MVFFVVMMTYLVLIGLDTVNNGRLLAVVDMTMGLMAVPGLRFDLVT